LPFSPYDLPLSDIHGWQLRFIVLKDSTLSYYKSAEDSDFGCRGAICLERAQIKESDIDDCRFDIHVNNLVWYLRCENQEDKKNWVEVLKSFRVSVILAAENTLSIYFN
jgi:collagen type IV alpha-3-binding protein